MKRVKTPPPVQSRAAPDDPRVLDEWQFWDGEVTPLVEEVRRKRADRERVAKEQTKPAAAKKRELGKKSLDRVVAEMASYQTRRYSRERASQLIAPKIGLSERQTYRLLGKAGYRTRK
jgi:hypothetical protein